MREMVAGIEAEIVDQETGDVAMRATSECSAMDLPPLVP